MPFPELADQSFDMRPVRGIAVVGAMLLHGFDPWFEASKNPLVPRRESKAHETRGFGVESLTIEVGSYWHSGENLFKFFACKEDVKPHAPLRVSRPR